MSTGVKTGLYSRAPRSAEDTCLPTARHPLLRQQEPEPGHFGERENLFSARIVGIGTDSPVVVMKDL
ncbi:hypothetical protein GC387_35150 [Pseudomonas sp. MWU12-2323]|nr:hypothetical protein [Pseudomonas sp. MWU12-2323]